MTYIDRLLDRLREQLPDCEPELLDFYALLAATVGPETTMRDVHNAWAIWRRATAPEHRSIIPFSELPADVRELDRPYMEAIHRAVEAQ